MDLTDKNLMDLMRERNNKTISYENYISQFKGLSRALANIHEKAIHRDIKPENILIKGETWLLSDFGLCKLNAIEEKELTIEGKNVGPRFWMSSESINSYFGNSDLITHSSDVFQLCSVFWFVVTGRHPTGWICKEDWSGPEEIFNVIYQALSHDSSNRPRNGQELLDRLNEATVV